MNHSNNSLSTLKPVIANDSVLEDCTIHETNTTTNDISISEVIVQTETQDPSASKYDTYNYSTLWRSFNCNIFFSKVESQLREITDVEQNKNKMAMEITKL